MTTAVLKVISFVDATLTETDTSCFTWCPGCEQTHPFRIRSATGQPTWDWDGNQETPTFSPSLLCHRSVHLCPDEHLAPCPGIDCGHVGHRRLYDGTLAVAGPHTANPAWGDCHSFLRAGRWEFLGDSAHHLAGQTVPMVQLPAWLVDGP